MFIGWAEISDVGVVTQAKSQASQFAHSPTEKVFFAVFDCNRESFAIGEGSYGLFENPAKSKAATCFSVVDGWIWRLWSKGTRAWLMTELIARYTKLMMAIYERSSVQAGWEMISRHIRCHEQATLASIAMYYFTA